jgi:DNA-binding transcriptional MerR regulator
MRRRLVPDSPPPLAMELFQPKPNVLYGLDATARLAGVPRRSILIYCRAGLVRPVVQPPYGVMEFTEEAIYTLRRIEYLRTVHGLDLAWIKTMFDLVDEVERLRAELRFLRNRDK